MPRLCCGCCFSRKKRKSFPIHEKQQRETEVTKVFVRHVENIRRTPPPVHQKTMAKATVKNKFDEAKTNSGTKKEPNAADCRVPASKLFRNSKLLRTPSPLPMTISDVHEKSLLNAVSSRSSFDSPEPKQNFKHRSDTSKEYSAPKKTALSPRKPSNGSKLVLENVRKMIQDQHIQQQRFNHSQQKESARL